MRCRSKAIIHYRKNDFYIINRECIGIHILKPSITPSEYEGHNPDTTALMPVALIAQLVEHCTGNAKVVGSNPVQSLNFFRSFFQ